jgi:Ca2+-binding RTX toxin-like protein
MRGAAIRLAFVALVGGLAILPPPAVAAPPDNCFGEPTNDPASTDLDDYLSGTGGVDIVALGDGNDQYFAGDDDDIICGNAGDDLLAGERGADRIDGGVGDDLVLGFSGGDVLFGRGGSDTIKGYSGDDVLRAGVDDETRDDLYDGPGNDTVIGGPEDRWFKCEDGQVDDHDAFDGITVPDPDCAA